MEVVVGHINCDFDALAATYAAGKLYPNAVLAFAGKVDRGVQEFLRLYGEALHILPPHQIKLGQIRRLIVVDTQVPHRLGPFGEVALRPEVEVIIYDHHPEGPSTIPAAEKHIKLVGATTTILVEALRRRAIQLKPWEATLLALGIYWDTGCLTFSHTTPEDLEAARWLLLQGANLDVVHDFVQRPLETEARIYLDRLMEAVEHVELDGLIVALAGIQAEGRVEGLGRICERLMEEEGADAAVVAIEHGEEVSLSARARTDALDVGRILSQFGGGGHKRAAAALVRGKRMHEVLKEVKQLLSHHLRPSIRAKDIMSYPVRTVTPETSVEEAIRVMLRYGHNGLVVTRNGKVVGIVSRRDLEKARRHGRGNKPVAHYMSHGVISVNPDTPLESIRRLMVDHDVGRLPVVEKGELVGIVTRTDVLRALHGMERPQPQEPPPFPVLKDVNLEIRLLLPPEAVQRLKEIGKEAQSMGFKAFAAGGFVRDLLLGVRNLDLDIAVEGDAIALAHRLGEKWGGRVVAHEQFGTATLYLPQGGRVDFATCRTEFYEQPAVLPQVEQASIREDLYRRDFTINAMAISLWPEKFGKLWDYFGGLKDLRRRIIRVLHNLSFVEDPTRILRAIRYEQRFRFRIEPQTERLLRQALEEGVLSLISADRIRAEVERALKEPHPERAFRRMEELGVLSAIFRHWRLGPEGWTRLRKARNGVKWFERAVGRKVERPHLVNLCAAIQGLASSLRQSLLRSLRFPSSQEEAVLNATEVADYLLAHPEEFQRAKPSQVYQRLRGLTDEGLAYLASLLPSPSARRRIARFAKEWRNARPLISGEDLKALGLPPGPLYGKILEAVLLAQLDGEAKDREAQLALAKRMAEEKGE